MFRLRMFLAARSPRTRIVVVALLLLLTMAVYQHWHKYDNSEMLNWLKYNRNTRLYLRPEQNTALLDVVTPCKKGVTLLLAVASRPEAVKQRHAVRETWGHALPQHTKLIFMLGYVASHFIQKKVMQEATQHGDIVIEDFIDNYHNLTLKTLFMLKWAVSHCSSASYVMKTDDDMLVNLRRVLREVESRDPGVPFVFGHLGHGEPQRSKFSRWYLPYWLYPYDELPNFLTGAGYVMSLAAVELLLNRAMEEPLINLEDVYVTGLLTAKHPAIPLLTVSSVRIERPPLFEHPCLLHHGYMVHSFTATDLVVTWKSLQQLDIDTCRATWVHCLASLQHIADFSEVPNTDWGP